MLFNCCQHVFVVAHWMHFSQQVAVSQTLIFSKWVRHLVDIIYYDNKIAKQNKGAAKVVCHLEKCRETPLQTKFQSVNMSSPTTSMIFFRTPYDRYSDREINKKKWKTTYMTSLNNLTKLHNCNFKLRKASILNRLHITHAQLMLHLQQFYTVGFLIVHVCLRDMLATFYWFRQQLKCSM